MNNFCPFINATCRTDCVFARSVQLGFGLSVGCILAEKLVDSNPTDFKALSDYIVRQQRKGY